MCHTSNCSRTRELSVNLCLCKFKPCFDYQHADTILYHSKAVPPAVPYKMWFPS
ncbi:hypothetical protein Peur_064683 [Populus x canadensis]